MSLRALHRRVSLWIQRPIGQLAGLLLLVAMISAGISTGEVHAHADGDHAHEHATQLADGLSDQDDAPGDLDPADTTVLHAHDVGTTVSTLPTLPTVMLSALVRSEEHTSELQSLMRISYAVFCLKKKHTDHLTVRIAKSSQRTE